MKYKTSLQLKYFTLSCALFFINGLAIAQEKIVIEPEKVETWFQKNQLWVYIGAGALLLIIIIASAGSSASRKTKKTTTVIRDKDGLTERVTTTEEQV